MDTGDAQSAGELHFVSAVVAIERKDYARALRETAAGIKIYDAPTPDLRRMGRILAHTTSGIAHAHAGRVREAVVELEAQAVLYRGVSPLERTWRLALEAEVALARGDLDRAAAAFSAAIPAIKVFWSIYGLESVLFNELPARDGLARVAIARGDLDGAINIYRGLLRYGPDSKWVAPYEPLYVLQMARLLEKKGDRKSALDEYQRFLTLWKNADAGLPELAEARQSLRKLRE